MLDAQRQFPLAWPVHVPRTERPTFSNFDPKWTDHQTYNEICDEVRKAGGSSLVVSSNLMLTVSGTPYARQRVQDGGVAVYFTRKGKQLCFACDKYIGVAQNLHAISKTIDAIRAIERWGTSVMVDAVFDGFLAIGAGSVPAVVEVSPWWTEMGLAYKPSSLSELATAYRSKVKTVHPDVGGSRAQWDALEAAYDVGLKELGG